MHHTEGIVLKKLDVGEADTLYSIYTRDYGKVRAVARGIRKNGAKLRGHLEPLSLTAVRLIVGRGGERLIGATLINFWERIRSREVTTRLAAYAARRVDEQCFAGEWDPALWDLMKTSFFVLDRENFSEDQAERFVREFDAGFSRCLGHGDDGGPDISGSPLLIAEDAGMRYHRE